jgi:hypothetical protein
MTLDDILLQARAGNDLHSFTLRRYCQHAAIRLAAAHPEKLFTLDDLRPFGVFDKCKMDSRWRTGITKELAQAGILTKVAYAESTCPGRGKRPMMTWRLTSDVALVLDWTSSHPLQKIPPNCQPTLFD